VEFLNTWSSTGGRKLGQIITMSVKHMGMVRDSVRELNNLVEKLDRANLEVVKNMFGRINSLEHEADNIKRSVMRELRLGLFHPLDREDLLRLIITADDIASFVKATARRMLLLYSLGYTISGPLLEVLKRLMKKTVESAEDLYEALISLDTDADKALHLITSVEELEEEIDEIRMEALNELYRLCSERFDARCMIMKEIIDDAENISDACEDTGDIIRIIAVSLA
jgi:predicted phosphate transport protein (TIGR00153 family)